MFLNKVPSTEDEQIVKSFAFPYQLGPTGMPAMVSPQNKTYVNIVALLMTAPGERVMRPSLGVPIYSFVFENMTPIQQARLANLVANAIETYIPGTRVNSVTPSSQKLENGIGVSIIFDIVYTVGGESREQQVILTPTTQGV
ncbi:MAG: GPW/gp25 family protein [Dehalococcoidales bacterium]|nr:GPW/gp25 family protein [Dehalococcoidales bacterium]